jgi:hypothetical protein
LSQITDVYAFNNAARGERTDGALIVDWALMRQAQLHITEETRELFDAIAMLRDRLPGADEDEALDLYREVFDGAVDLAWVALNVLYAGGCTAPEQFWEAAAQANLAKIPDCVACSGDGRIGQSRFGLDPMEAAAVGLVGPCPDCNGTGKGPPLMNADKKILKPEGWQPPDVAQLAILRKMMHRRWFKEGAPGNERG